MTVEVRFLNREGWKVEHGWNRRPVNETELVGTQQEIELRFKGEIRKIFWQDRRRRLIVTDKVEGAEVRLDDLSGRLGGVPMGVDIKIERYKSAVLEFDGEAVAEIKHIPTA